MHDAIREEIKGILSFLGVIWGVFVLSLVVSFDINKLGITPRHPIGLVGIPLMPFLHASFQHVVSNTIPLFVLLVLLSGSRARSWEVVVEIVILSGLLLWLFGRPAIHLGASGLVFGLISFLIASGFFERRLIPLTVAVVVGFLYGTTLFVGIIPDFGSSVSWDGHLCGMLSGIAVAYAAARIQPILKRWRENRRMQLRSQ